MDIVTFFNNMNNTVLYIHVTYVYVCVSVSLIPWWTSGGLFLYQFSSVTRSCPTLCDPMDCSISGLPVHHQPLEFTQTHAHEVGDAILYCPLLFLPSVFPSIRVFSSESVLCIRWPKYWSFSFNISPSSEYSGLISFRIDWFDLLAVQGTLRSLLQHHNSKHQLFGTQPSLWFSSQIHTWLLEKP